ncbi:hypothetical protein [Microscilla marina]|uniref:Uncharacterized protein n=1 Tax=Microscilla marina ATCC 23134 TaxID=313606 RepID=A1ZZV2_MICM2|nr:hypothetical protein [Microscilla marina]EAY24113.1 conserved hypothetical protein [Microscilla marina ATCC 23134]
MKAASIREIKHELNNMPQGELIELCLKMSKFKKENKELLTYLLFEANNEANYIESIKEEMDVQFANINLKSAYFAKKSIRKIQRMVKKFIKYSKHKETEVELLIYFCIHLNKVNTLLGKSLALRNINLRQIATIRKTITYLHEDLQYDYKIELDEIAAKV